MTDKNKNRMKLRDFIRYRQDEMTPVEKNAFERELQRDPFSRDAEEGFSDLPAKQIIDDISKLRHSLAKRTGRSRRIIAYRIAASVAVLMIISSVMIVINKNKREAQLPLIADQVVSAEIKREEPVFSKPVLSEKAEEPVRKAVPDEPVNIVQMDEGARETGKDYKVNEPADVKAFEKVAAPQFPDRKKAESDMVSRQERTISARSMTPAAGKSTVPVNIRGKVLSEEDGLPVAGASIVIKGTDRGAITDAGGNFSIDVPDSNTTLVAGTIGMLPREFIVNKGESPEIKLSSDVTSLSEVVVTGYGVSRTEAGNSEETFSPAQPAGGKADFDRYIRDNIHRPDSATAGQRVVVVAVFIVRTNGYVDSIGIERSPSKPFTDEAVRLIKQGPAWKPAQRNGIPVDDKVRIRIIFR